MNLVLISARVKYVRRRGQYFFKMIDNHRRSRSSAAEIFYDLLTQYKNNVHWHTRNQRFYALEYSKLTWEMTSPDYIDHFYYLSGPKTKRIIQAGHTL